jgi:threonine dehydrogenase-like Zn-dependent dehydrogenase
MLPPMAAPLPETTRVALYKGERRVDIEERSVPELGDHEVLVAVDYCGVCGSDVHLVLEGWGQPGPVGGHELSGTIAAVGPGVTRWSPGDLVVGGPSPRCGTCEYCRAGRSSLCSSRGAVGESPADGAFADYMVTGEEALLALPPGVGLRDAALAEPLTVALHGISRSGASPPDRVLVTGGGPIGMLTTAALVHRGIDEVVLSEPSPVRRALGTELGATVVSPEDLVVPASPSSIVEHPFDVAIECSGHASAMEHALAQLKRAGTLVFVGAGMRRPKIDSNRVLLNELTITGAFCYDDGGFEAALLMLASPAFPRHLLVEPVDVGLEGLGEAIESLGAGEIAAKVLIAPGASGKEG